VDRTLALITCALPLALRLGLHVAILHPVVDLQFVQVTYALVWRREAHVRPARIVAIHTIVSTASVLNLAMLLAARVPMQQTVVEMPSARRLEYALCLVWQRAAHVTPRRGFVAIPTIASTVSALNLVMLQAARVPMRQTVAEMPSAHRLEYAPCLV
jgi:hypothetical protein